MRLQSDTVVGYAKAPGPEKTSERILPFGCADDPLCASEPSTPSYQLPGQSPTVGKYLGMLTFISQSPLVGYGVISPGGFHPLASSKLR